MIAAKILGYYWIHGKSNPADTLGISIDMASPKNIVILFWQYS
jgi:hypothetical protein